MTSNEAQMKWQDLPDQLMVSVVLQCVPLLDHQWLDERWLLTELLLSGQQEYTVVRLEERNNTSFVFSGLTLGLFEDECDSYYLNLLSDKPRCYVVAHETRLEEQDGPDSLAAEAGCSLVPLLVTVSFDVAHAYEEGDDQVFDVPMPAQIYGWVEAFVLEYYAPKKRHKRKRDDWKNAGKVRQPKT